LPDNNRTERAKLAEALRAMREATGLTQTAFAERLGWQQSRLSKIETGRQFPGADDIAQWASAAGVKPAALLGQLERAKAEHATWAEHYRRAGGAAAKQVSIGGRYESASQVSKFQPVMIPSQIQTAEYASELLRSASGPRAWGTSDDEIDEMVAARIARQQILYRPGKLIEIVILEAALHTRLVSPRAMAGQLDRMLAVEGLAALDLGIIPATALVPVYPTSGFVVFDNDLVVVETIGGEDQISDPDEVRRYADWFRLLHAAALHGREAAGLIRAALAAHRGD
jgi:transcriptional regulator with XRE-family HTH domain